MACLFALVALVCVAPQPSPAAIVVLTGNEEPVYGFTTERPNGFVVAAASRDPKPLLIPKAKVAEVIPTVSAERLAGLSPADPQACFQYADELFAMQRDPEARETAIRLYLIAGRAAPERFARGALLSLQRLASPESARRIAAFGLTHGWLAPGDLVLPSAGTEEKPKPAAELIKVLRAIRQGKRTVASRAWQSPEAAEQLSRYASRFSAEEMREALETDRLSRRQLARIVALEIAIEDDVEQKGKKVDEVLPWSVQISGSKSAAARPLNWESLVDSVDPRDNKFHDGVWTRER